MNKILCVQLTNRTQLNCYHELKLCPTLFPCKLVKSATAFKKWFKKLLVKTGFYAMELLTAPSGYLAHMDADGSMLSLRYYEGLIALCKGIQNSLGFWIPRRGFQIPGPGFQYLSVD